MDKLTREPQHVCAVCGRVLELVTDLDRGGATVGWVHPFAMRQGLIGESEDHEPVPVPRDDLPHPDTRCDFCYANNPQWLVPANDFVDVEGVRDLSLPGAPGTGSRGDWGACDECADLIRMNRWEFLVRRVKRAYAALHGEPMHPYVERYVRKQYKELRRQITGAPHRIGEESK